MFNRHLIASLFLIIIANVIPYESIAGNCNGWIFQNHYPTSNTLMAVKFLTPKKGWVVGDAGTILHTEDGGETWEAQESGTAQPLISLAIINEKVGWAAGRFGVIIHTNDGGKTWITQLETKADLSNIYFLDDKEGWAVGQKMPLSGSSKGALLHTVDGGQKWEEIDHETESNIAGIYFINKQTGWLLAGGDIYRTLDGGRKWDRSNLSIKRPISSPNSPIGAFFQMMDLMRADIVFKDERAGWVVVGGDVYYTNDGGNEWSQIYSSPHDNLQRFYLDDERICAINSVIVCSSGGKDWSKIYDAGYDFSWLGPDYRTIQIWIGGIQFVNEGEAWAVGANGLIMKTNDGGKRWNLKNTVLEGTHFINKKAAWAFRQDKESNATDILKTEDGGKTWKVQKRFKDSIKFESYWMLSSGKRARKDETAPLETTFNKIFVLDENRAWFAGHQYYARNGSNLVKSFILHTPNGGETWTQQFELPKQKWSKFWGDIGDIFFLNAHLGWASGSNGLILHTIDGGKTWQRQKSGTNIYLTKILFADAKKGWAIGGNIAPGGYYDTEEDTPRGIVLSTSDGGAHWAVQWKKKEVALDYLSFLDQNVAWVQGETDSNALILYTNDGGKMWIELTGEQSLSGAPCWLDKKRGWIHVDERNFQTTLDSGKTWKKVKVQPRRDSWHISELLEKSSN